MDSVHTALGENIRLEPTILKSKGKSNRLKALLMLPVPGYGFLIKGKHAELGRQNNIITPKTIEFNAISYWPEPLSEPEYKFDSAFNKAPRISP